MNCVLRLNAHSQSDSSSNSARDRFLLSIDPSSARRAYTPLELQSLITFLVTGRGALPPLVTASRTDLCARVFFAVFDGIDTETLRRHRDHLSNFTALSERGAYARVCAERNGNWIASGADSVIGLRYTVRRGQKFGSIDEMCLSPREMYDNGYPLPPGTERPRLGRRCRYEFFHLSALSDSDIAQYAELPKHTDGALDVLGVDCEMVETERGSELARLSCVDRRGRVVVDEYFLPDAAIIDYRTETSGITAEVLSGATKRIGDVAAVLAPYADAHTILVGHSLESDLRAMKLIHTRVVDTALVYNLEIRFPFKASLSKLYSKYINKPLRDDGCAHSSSDDARAAVELCEYAIENAVSAENFEPRIPKLFVELAGADGDVNVFTTRNMCEFQKILDGVNCEVQYDDAVLEEKLLASMDSAPRFSYACFNAATRCAPDSEEETAALKRYNEILGRLVEAIPENSALIVYTSCGNMKRLKKKNGNPIPYKSQEYKVVASRLQNACMWALAK